MVILASVLSMAAADLEVEVEPEIKQDRVMPVTTEEEEPVKVVHATLIDKNADEDDDDSVGDWLHRASDKRRKNWRNKGNLALDLRE